MAALVVRVHGWWLVVWIVAAIVAIGPLFLQEGVHGFLNG